MSLISNSKKRRKRKYANFFDWHNKQRKELGVLEDFVKSLRFRNEAFLSSCQIYEKDPPDCLAYDEKGNIVAFEIVELVSEEAVINSEKGENLIHYWENEEVVEKIQSILRKKDRKQFNGGPYSRIILLIFTDEYTLSYQRCLPIFSSKIFKNISQTNEAFLLFSFDPYENHCPYIRLLLSK